MRSDFTKVGARIRPLCPLLVVLAIWTIFIVVNPVGYVGGGHDDTHYLAAARCWAEHGPCLPIDHWWRRFPLVAPVGLVIALFGLSQQTLWIVPAIYSAAAAILLTIIVQRQFGGVAGLLAGATFVLTPAVGSRVLDLGIDLPEAALMFAAVASLQWACFRKARGLFALSGILLALAVQCRPTVLAAVPIFCIGLLLIDRRGFAFFLIGLAIPILLETAAYQWAVGDPLLSWKLSLAHTKIPSSELNGVDLSRSPLFNTQFIQAWRPIAGIPAHWLVQGPVNLIVSRKIGITLYLSLALLVLNARRIGTARAGGPVLLFVVIASAFYFVALNYVFAIDPTPRMFLPVLAAACAVIGVLAPLSWRGPQRIVVLLFLCAIVGRALIVPFERMDARQAIPLATQWLRSQPEIEVDPSTYSRLVFIQKSDHLREYHGERNKRVLVIDFYPCRQFAIASGNPQWQVIREVDFPKGAAKNLLDDLALRNGANDPVLCLFDSAGS